MSVLLLDTSFVLALELSGDQYHRRARDYWSTLAGSSSRLVTSSFVLCETVSFFESRNRHDKADQVGTWLMQAPDVRFVHIDGPLLEAAWLHLAKHRDKTYSLTDCVSFVLMRQLDVRAALTFDHHIVQAGFRTLP